jgi:hypothetical protein
MTDTPVQMDFRESEHEKWCHAGFFNSTDRAKAIAAKMRRTLSGYDTKMEFRIYAGGLDAILYGKSSGWRLKWGSQ